MKTPVLESLKIASVNIVKLLKAVIMKNIWEQLLPYFFLRRRPIYWMYMDYVDNVL